MTVGLMHRLISWFKIRFPRFGEVVDGTPLVVLKNGEWQTEVMEKMRLQDVDVMAAARTKGVKTLAEIKYAILERNGAISIVKRSQ
jgi:uncharacterized membrane protein YcaP (DUF421 family)